MSNEETNVALLKRLYGRWDETKGACIDEWLDCIDEDIAWRSLAEGTPGLEFTAEASGRDRVRAYFEGLTQALEMIHYTVDEYVAQGDRVVAIGSTAWRNPQNGKSFDMPKVDVFGFRDGRIVSFFEFYDTAKAASIMIDD